MREAVPANRGGDAFGHGGAQQVLRSEGPLPTPNGNSQIPGRDGRKRSEILLAGAFHPEARAECGTEGSADLQKIDERAAQRVGDLLECLDSWVGLTGLD